MKILKKMGSIYNRFEELFLVGILAFSVVIIFVQVISRYVFNNSLSWSEEVARYLFVWMIWMGTSIAARDRAHISVELVRGRFTGRAGIGLDLVIDLIWLAACVFFAVNGTSVIQSMIPRAKMASSLPWLPMWTVYLALPVSQAVLGIRIVKQIVDDLFRLFHGNPQEPSGDHTEGAA